GGAALTLLTTGLARMVLPSVSLRLVLLLAVADFFFGRISDAAAQAFQGLDRMALTAALTALPNGVRFVAAGALVSISSPPATDAWASWYLLGAIASAAAAVGAVSALLGRPRPSLAVATSGLREGGYFSVNLAAATIYADIDKAMLARMASFDAAGVY